MDLMQWVKAKGMSQNKQIPRVGKNGRLSGRPSIGLIMCYICISIIFVQ